MKHVIFIEDGMGALDAWLVRALRSAGFMASGRELPADDGWPGLGACPETQELLAPRPSAVLIEVAAGAEVSLLADAVRRAAAAWPDAALVALRSGPPNGDPASHDGLPSNGHGAPNGRAPHGRLETAALERMGFRAVADDPAQLPALLRDLEARGLAEELPRIAPEARPRRPAADASTPTSLLLPERLSVAHLRAAFELVASLHLAGDQKGAASTALVGLASLVEADRWTIYLAAEVGDELVLDPLAARGLTASEREPQGGDWRRALVVGDAVSLAGQESGAAREAIRRASVACAAEGGRHVLAVPLVAGERVIGVVEAVREGVRALPFPAHEESLLSALALPLSASLSNAVRIAEAERLSQTDDLTKLHNARFLRQYLIGEVKRARRYGSPVSAMFMDLDDFKGVNDRYGHLVGSHVLMEMAAVILSSVRDTDVVSRYGGDEFVVILPETGAEPAALVAERVRERISLHTFTGGRSLRLRLTASFGIACFPEHAASPQQLVAAADAAMYEAKAARKNCVRFAAGDA